MLQNASEQMQTEGGPQGARRGARAPLTEAQMACLFRICCDVLRAPWVAVAALLQTCLGERVTCVTRSRMSWFTGLAANDDVASDNATASIPKVNRKTKARQIPLPRCFATMLHSWLRAAGCDNDTDIAQWPLATTASDAFGLPFSRPSRWSSGRKTTYVDQILDAASLPKTVARRKCPRCQTTAEFQTKHQPHPFDGFDLKALGTHSFKKKKNGDNMAC